ncbi:MAG: sugar phosphate isomerase/epimerase [Bacteroidota bacterium]|nr:sugar phosphate isomerase/epimerase [Bacteroidota bacterium]
MNSRRHFLKSSGAIAIGSILLPQLAKSANRKTIKDIGLQLYTVRDEMMVDSIGTLKKIASLGYKEIESATSAKGYYYGLKPAEMKQICADHGMTLRSGHVRYDDKWQQTIDEAAESGQEYLIVPTMPTRGQTVDNYKRAAEIFNKAGEACNKSNIILAYHNHDAEFEKDNGKVLYDVLLENANPEFVKMEMDLGWVIMAGFDPLDYFAKYPGRFPLWHLKDMNMKERHSTEFGKGALDVKKMMQHSKQSGMKYFFVEQEEYTGTADECLEYNIKYLNNLKY